MLNRPGACPTCNRNFPPIIRVGGRRRQAMFDYVSEHPEGVTAWQILSAIWGDSQPDSPNIVSVMRRKINCILRDLGHSCHIESDRGGPGSVYRLVER
jgi:hypothetical protein